MGISISSSIFSKTVLTTSCLGTVETDKAEVVCQNIALRLFGDIDLLLKKKVNVYMGIPNSCMENASL